MRVQGIKRIRRRLLLSVLPGLVLLSACDGSGDFGHELKTGPGGGGDNQASSSPPPFLYLMVGANERNAYRGVREVEIVVELLGNNRTLLYHEEVGSDGQGMFDVLPLTVLAPPLRAEEEELFLLRQAGRDGLVHRFRDFQVRDVDRYEANYDLEILSTNFLVAGVPCVKFRAEPLVNPTYRYEVWVDDTTGVVLRWEQRDMVGALLARAEFQSFNYDADVSDMDLRGDLFVSRPLDPEAPLEPQLGFRPLEPTQIPVGYELVLADEFVGPEGESWLRRIYDDGVDRLAFLQTFPAGSSYGGASSIGPVDVVEASAWSIVTGKNLLRSRVILLARVPSAQLLGMLQSAMPK